jgi:RNA polymerase sigma-70 factor (ECF subfamily)
MSHLSSGPQADCDRFQTTHWSLVVSAGDRKSARADEALASLCADYWPPLYAYIRRSGHSLHAAQDLTQEFFARLLEKNYVQSADPERGRFRSFLLGAVKHFLSNHKQAARAQKRGGGQPLLSLDFRSAEAAYQLEPADSQTPDRLFEQQWALLLLDRILQRGGRFAAAGMQHWEVLRVLTAGGTIVLTPKQPPNWARARLRLRWPCIACENGIASFCGTKSAKPWPRRPRLTTKSGSSLRSWPENPAEGCYAGEKIRQEG